MRLGRQPRALVLLSCLVVSAASYPKAARGEETDSANVVAARQHFEHARTFYAQGSYREALSELEAAHSLDPSAKDLVFNLGVVHEKLSDIDDALHWFQLYTTMNLTPQEHERADAYIRRLEGAKREVAQKSQGETAPSTPQGTPSTTADIVMPPPEEAPHGRVDAATIVTASVAGGALAFGTVMGIKALADKPPNGTVVQRQADMTNLQSEANRAHTEAVVADIAFGTAIVAAVAAGLLYIERPRDTQAARATQRAKVSAAPLLGGGAFVVQGSF